MKVGVLQRRPCSGVAERCGCSGTGSGCGRTTLSGRRCVRVGGTRGGETSEIDQWQLGGRRSRRRMCCRSWVGRRSVAVCDRWTGAVGREACHLSASRRRWMDQAEPAVGVDEQLVGVRFGPDGAGGGGRTAAWGDEAGGMGWGTVSGVVWQPGWGPGRGGGAGDVFTRASRPGGC